MLPPDCKTVASNEKDRALDIFTLAFVYDPMLRWIYADGSRYLKHLGAVQYGLGGRAVAKETAYVLADYSAASFWLPPGVTPDDDALAALIESTVPADKQNDLGGVIEQMQQYHPHEPHWYLAVLGVDVSRQGRGLGSILMKHTLHASTPSTCPPTSSLQILVTFHSMSATDLKWSGAFSRAKRPC